MRIITIILAVPLGGALVDSFGFSACQAAVQNGSLGTAGVTDRDGNPTTNISLAEGYEYSYCLQNCGGGFQYHGYKEFSEQATLWFLPWFSLVAQVPYFTQHKWDDILTMFLTIGSPTTAFYSLFITIFDRNWLQSYCKTVSESGPNEDKTLQDISEVLFSLHQFSFAIVAVNGHNSLSDRQWWARLRKWFVGRRRHMEASGYAQLFLTVTVYALAVLPVAFADVGDNATAHGLAIGNLWMWLIPLVWGWFAVGTHHGRRRQVLEEIRDSWGLNIGLRCSEILSFPDSRQPYPDLYDETHPAPREHRVLGFTVHGDVLADGPFYNYARCLSWTYVSKNIVDGYRRSASSMFPDSDLTPATRESYASSRDTILGKDETLMENRSGWTGNRAAILGLGGLTARRIRAFVLASFLHAVFGCSAFMIDYMTPTIGVGCRAFICATYTAISFLSCVLLAVAACISEQLKFGRDGMADGSSHKWAIVSVFMRVLAKILATANGVFIMIACFFEFIGVYESCFCKSDYLSLRGRAFVSFLGSEEAAQIARPFWYAGSGVAMITVLAVCFGYFIKVHQKAKTE